MPQGLPKPSAVFFLGVTKLIKVIKATTVIKVIKVIKVINATKEIKFIIIIKVIKIIKKATRSPVALLKMHCWLSTNVFVSHQSLSRWIY